MVTGAPGTGKTSIIKGLEKSGFYCFHEVIRNMTAAAKHDRGSSQPTTNPLLFVKDPYQFNTGLLKARIADFVDADRLQKKVCFFDRGIPDVLAYMDYFKQEYEDHFIMACELNRYEKVLLLPPWKEIYVSDNERLESFSEAEDIHEHLVETYSGFGYSLIEVPKRPVQERIDFIIKKLAL